MFPEGMSGENKSMVHLENDSKSMLPVDALNCIYLFTLFIDV